MKYIEMLAAIKVWSLVVGLVIFAGYACYAVFVIGRMHIKKRKYLKRNGKK